MVTIKQAYDDAKKEYDKVTQELDEKAERLNLLKRKKAEEEYEGERIDLEGEIKKLEDRETFWRKEMGGWGKKIRKLSP